jgi:diguanylate cyclase (GGDEF)-like protein
MDANPPQLLVVDDDPTSIQVIAMTLDEIGEVSFATDGESALRMLATQPADLVLLDAEMPGMDGFATCAAIRDAHPDLPVIFVTAASDPASEVRALELGAVDFISKPVNPPVVVARINTHLKLKRYGDELRALATRDPLTGVANRRALFARLDHEWRRAARSGVPLSLMMIDVDFFKRYNDHYGHPEGDACLRRVAEAISAAASRAGDLVARYGGEEFAVLMADTPPERAELLALRVRDAVRALGIPHARSEIADRVTVSIGVADAIPAPERPVDADGAEAPASGAETPAARALFSRADRALYEAKRAGRDRVVRFGRDR